VTLRITDTFYGGLHLSGLTYGSRLYHGMQVYDTTCGSTCGVVSPNTNYTASEIITSKKSYFLHTFSGDTLSLVNVIFADLGAGGEGGFSASASSNAARLYGDPVNSRVLVTSASGRNYSSPVSSGLNSVPSIIGETQSTATAAIVKAGLIVGTVSKQSSTTASAKSVISQNPTAGDDVAAGSAVNLVVSTGPIRGDINLDGQVDSLDVQLINEALNAPSAGPNDPRDLNHDGVINSVDVRIEQRLCTYPGCATQ
jgi:hypothetical protein